MKSLPPLLKFIQHYLRFQFLFLNSSLVFHIKLDRYPVGGDLSNNNVIHCVTGTATESTKGLVFLLENGRDRTEAVKLSIAHCSQLPNQTRPGWELVTLE